MSTEQNKAVVRRYYDEMWNRWDMALVDEIISEDVAFRGSLSVNAEGRDGFEYYMELVRTAFPDFHNQIEELIAEGDKVVARLYLYRHLPGASVRGSSDRQTGDVHGNRHLSARRRENRGWLGKRGHSGMFAADWRNPTGGVGRLDEKSVW